jgi:hypothetical protein
VRDAGIPTTLSGKVCVLDDPRHLDSCDETVAAGLTVGLDGSNATTTTGGVFTIAAPTSTVIQWTVTGTGLVPSITPYSLINTLYALSTTTYDAMISANTVTMDAEGQGDVLGYIEKAGSGVTMEVAVAAPTGARGTLYEDSASVWDGANTLGDGAIWVPGTATGGTTITVTGTNGTGSAADVPVGSQTITFVTISVH